MNVIVLVNEMQNHFKYFSLTVQQKNSLCLKMNIVPVTSEIVDVEEGVQWIQPYQTKGIAGAGNCFFRALSHVASGTETNNRKIRLAMVQHMTVHPGRYLSSLKHGYTSTLCEHYVTEP